MTLSFTEVRAGGPRFLTLLIRGQTPARSASVPAPYAASLRHLEVA